MNIKDVKDRINKIFQKFEEIQVPTYNLTDGRVVSIDKLEIGGKVLLTDGTVPSNAEDLELDDGTILAIDENGVITAVVTPQAMETVSLLDGTTLSVSALEVGASVLFDGQPAKEGSYTLSDNTVISVGADGKITSVTPPPTEVEVDYSNITKEQFDALKEKFEGGMPDQAAMWSMVKALMEYNFGWQIRQTQQEQITNEAISAYKQNYAEVQKENESLKALFGEMLSIVQEIAKEPAAPLPEKKTRMSLQDPNRRVSQLERMAKAAERVNTKK